MQALHDCPFFFFFLNHLNPNVILLRVPKVSNHGVYRFLFTQWKNGSEQSEWLRSKSLQAINAGEGVEKREPSYTVGGNAN